MTRMTPNHRVVAPQTRREQVRRWVGERGFARTEELAEAFGVSTITVRRDLEALQEQGWLRKVPGGAAALPWATVHPGVAKRMATMSEAKARLADAALELVFPGQTVMLDESTTCLHVARLLSRRAPLTVITHFLTAVNLLAGQSGITLVTLGGTYVPTYDAFLGLHTAEAVASFRADLLLVSAGAVTAGECYQRTEDTVHVKRAMMHQAARRVLLVEHTKFRREGFYYLAPVTDFDLVLTDAGTDQRDRHELDELGVDLRVV